MALLPNEYHPGLRCNCRDCLAQWPPAGSVLFYDAERYRWLRDKAIKESNLEAFIALSQLDYISSSEQFDAFIDAAMHEDTK